MTKDIWDEKPVRPSSETRLMFERRRYSWEYQLKIEYDKLKEKAEKYDKEHKVAMIIEEELRKIDDKLEAVKSWYETQVKDNIDSDDIPRSGKLFRFVMLLKNLEELGEILGVES